MARWLGRLTRMWRCASSVALALVVIGCADIRGVDPLNHLQRSEHPIRIGVTELEMSPSLLLPRRTLFEENLEFHLHESVCLELMTARQIGIHLGTGRLQFAMLTPADYAEIAPAQSARILAVPLNDHSTTSRRGLIVVSAKSSLQKLQELKGSRFHFLPRADVLNEVALGALFEAGVHKQEGEPDVPESDRDSLPVASRQVAQSVVLDEGSAGVVDEADYTEWKAEGGDAARLDPSQQELRVIGRTVSVPQGPVVVSNQTSPELAQKVGDYLLKVASDKPMILSSLSCRGFSASIQPKDYKAYFMVHRRLHPPSSTTAASGPADESAGR